MAAEAPGTDGSAPRPAHGEGGPGGASEAREPRMRLPAAAMVLAVLGAGIVAAAVAAWLTGRIAVAPAAPAPGAVDAAVAAPDPIRSSVLGSTVSVAVALAGILVLMPWKTRPAGTWATLWLAGTVGRLLITPLVALAVYSATPVGMDPFLLSLAGTYLACLAAEVAVSARGVARALEAGEASDRRPSSPRSNSP